MQTAADPISLPRPILAERPERWSGFPALRAWILDAAAIAFLSLAALAIRLPHLWTVPRFTDETLEVLHSLDIVRAGARPLTNYDSYYGALHNYLVAAALWLSSESPLAPRALVLLAGPVTCAFTYLLARDLVRSATVENPAAVDWSRLAGLVAGLMLATNGAHVAVSSHIAWSNCLTPLFTTAALLLLVRGASTASVTGVSGPALAGAGLLFGLALQTHPLVITLLPGIAIFVLWRARRSLATPWPYVAVALFLLAYANVLVYNWQNGWETVISARRIQAEYTSDDQASVGYAAAVGAMLVMLARLLGGAVDQRESIVNYLADPIVTLGVLLAIAGVLVFARRGQPLPLLACVSLLALLPMVNPKFQTLLTSRYLMPIVPLLMASSAALLAGPIVQAARGRSGEPSRSHIVILSAIGAGVAAAALILAPLGSLDRYYARAFQRSDTNERIFRLASEVAAIHRATDERVVIDDSMGAELPDTGLTEVRGFEHLLIFERVPYRAVRISPSRLQDELRGESSVLAVLNARDAAAAAVRLAVTSLDSRPTASSGRASDYRIYRLAPRASRQSSAFSPPPDVG